MKLPSRTFRRYLLLEIPGWTLAAVGLWLAEQHAGLSPTFAIALWLLWVAKDLALYPWLRDAYEDGNPEPGAALIGRRGEARDRLDPSGYVRVGPELWRAQLAPDQPPVETGGAVRVRSLRGLTLVVESEETSAAEA